MIKLRNAIVLIIVSLVLSACCKSSCDCLQDSMRIKYQSFSEPCPSAFDSLVQVKGFNTAGDTIYIDGSSQYQFDCIIDLSLSQGYTWIISSDSLKIADTVSVIDITMAESDDKCCDCGPYVTDIRIRVNDSTYTETGFIRQY